MQTLLTNTPSTQTCTQPRPLLQTGACHHLNSPEPSQASSRLGLNARPESPQTSLPKPRNSRERPAQLGRREGTGRNRRNLHLQRGDAGRMAGRNKRWHFPAPSSLHLAAQTAQCPRPRTHRGTPAAGCSDSAVPAAAHSPASDLHTLETKLELGTLFPKHARQTAVGKAAGQVISPLHLVS